MMLREGEKLELGLFDVEARPHDALDPDAPLGGGDDLATSGTTLVTGDYKLTRHGGRDPGRRRPPRPARRRGPAAAVRRLDELCPALLLGLFAS